MEYYKGNLVEYTGPIEVRPSFGKGRGLFAQRDINKGEWLLVEKPFVSSDDSGLTDK